MTGRAGLPLGDARQAVTAACRRLVVDGLVVGTAGNLSVRVGGQIAVTPTGVAYEALTPADICVRGLDGTAVDGALRPTSELPLHLAVYAMTGAGAVVHTHSVAATALSCLVDEVPPVHYYIALFGGLVRVAPYAEYGTPELAAGAVEALRDRTGCLLGNHGAVTIGDTLDLAYERARYLEWLCDVALRALSAGVGPRLLTAAQLDAVAPRLAAYGQPPASAVEGSDAPEPDRGVSSR